MADSRTPGCDYSGMVAQQMWHGDMTPKEHFTELEAENRQQREQTAELLERVRDLEALRTVGEEDGQAFRQGESLVRAIAVSDERLEQARATRGTRPDALERLDDQEAWVRATEAWRLRHTEARRGYVVA